MPRLSHPALRAAAIALVIGVQGCGAPELRWPFPRVDAASDEALIRTLAGRIAGVNTLYAVLSMSFELPERSGVADSVVRYRRPGTLRMSAFKSILVTSRNIFDLCLTPDRFDIKLETDNGPDRQTGPADDLLRLYPGFRAVGALREAMFLPGLLDPGSPPQISRREGGIFVRTLAPSNSIVEYELDPATLGVRRSRLSLRGAVVTVDYTSYREVEGRYFPERFELKDPETHVQISGVVEEIEVNPDLGSGEFKIDE